jgi:hypothetical protein
MVNCTVSGNSSDAGGGVSSENLFGNSAPMLAMTNCTVSANSAYSYYGGGLLAGGTATLTNAIVVGNKGNDIYAPSALGGGASDAPWIEVTGSSHLASWLAEQRLSLAFTTYQTGKLFFLGLRPDGGLAVFERTFSRAMGLWADGQTLWLSTLYQLWRFENVLRPGETHQEHDRLNAPDRLHDGRP